MKKVKLNTSTVHTHPPPSIKLIVGQRILDKGVITCDMEGSQSKVKVSNEGATYIATWQVGGRAVLVQESFSLPFIVQM